jgi:transcriptional regulator NrdR family protein
VHKNVENSNKHIAELMTRIKIPSRLANEMEQIRRRRLCSQ